MDQYCCSIGVRKAGFTIVESILSLSVLALAALIATSCLVRSVSARDRSLALRHAPFAIATLAAQDLPAGGCVIIRDEEGRWLLVSESSPRLADYHDLRYNVTLEEHGQHRLAHLQWAPAGQGSDDEGGQNPHWTRLGTVILHPTEP